MEREITLPRTWEAIAPCILALRSLDTELVYDLKGINNFQITKQRFVSLYVTRKPGWLCYKNPLKIAFISLKVGSG